MDCGAMAAQSAVNRWVVGSNPTSPAKDGRISIMDLYEELTPEEKAYHDAMISIAEKYGPFDQGTSSIWVGYEGPEDNEDAEIGVKCSNCSLHNMTEGGQMGCAILSYPVHPDAKCRLAAIPDGYVNVSNDDENDGVGKFWAGSFIK